MALSFLPKNAFPLPASITPKLIALGLDDKAAAKVSNVYLSSALTLKGMLETEYINACNALLAASDNRGYSSKELRVKLLTVSITRYMQALSKCLDESIEKAEAFLLTRDIRSAPQPKMTRVTTPSPDPSRKNTFALGESTHPSGHILFSTNNPLYAFPRSYPPPARPDSISFVTHIPLFKKGSRHEPKTISDGDLDACIDALSRLSLGPPSHSPQSRSSHKSSKPMSKSRSHTYTTLDPKLISRLSPSRPRLVSPILDTSIAVSHKPLPKHTLSQPTPITIPRTQNIDIPRSSRRKACSIPYRRPTIHPSTSPESPSSSPTSHRIRRTPSLISDHGSEASSPSTPPDFPSMPTPTSAISCKDFFLEAMSPFENTPVSHPGWRAIDFGTDIYG